MGWFKDTADYEWVSFEKVSKKGPVSLDVLGEGMDISQMTREQVVTALQQCSEGGVMKRFHLEGDKVYSYSKLESKLHFRDPRLFKLLLAQDQIPIEILGQEICFIPPEHARFIKRISLKEFSSTHLKEIGKFLHLEDLLIAHVIDHSLSWYLEYLKPVRGVSFDLHNLSDEGLKMAAQIPGLKRLGGRFNHGLDTRTFSDEGIAHLSVLKNLRELDLSDSQVTDEGLLSLHGEDMECLELSHTEISDHSVGILTQWKNLKLLQIFDTHVTREGVSALKKALPSTEIRWCPKLKRRTGGHPRTDLIAYLHKHDMKRVVESL